MAEIGHFLHGRPVPGASGRFGDVFNPATGEVQARLALGNDADVAAAVASAKSAQGEWAARNPQTRARVLAKFVALLNANLQPLAELMSREHGKTIADSVGDLQRGLEVAEFAAGIPHLSKGEFSDGAGPGIDVYTLRQPLGIGAGITPFNFPGMIPMWMFAPAIACGNAFILKPSERVPSVPLRLAELLLEAGLPPGILNIVNGDKQTVDAIIAHPGISGISFVGSTPVAASVYAAAAAQGKRVQCFGGAKNHAVILPDADMDQAADALIGAGYGSAGQRCMAVSVAVPVGEETARRLAAALQPRIENLKVGPYGSEGADFGPVITGTARDRIAALVDQGVKEGAQLLVDGRGFKMQGYEKGFYIGACLFDHVTPAMLIYKTEIFGPVLSVVRAGTYEEALGLVSDHEYGNGCAIFTRDGDAARDFAARAQAGMVGINVPVPAPLAYYSFGGWKRSSFGDLNQHGPDGIKFWSRTKTVTARWPSGIKSGAEFSMPTPSKE